MKKSEQESGQPGRHPGHRVAFIAAALVATTACSEDSTRDASAPVTTSDAASPFARLTDPSGCVIEQITAADYDEFQVWSVSADSSLLAIAARIEGDDETSTVYEVHEVELATGKKMQLSMELTNSGAYSPDGRFIVLAQETDDGRTDIVEYERATGTLRTVAAHEHWDWLPSYSPDGRFIVFNSYRVDGQADIHLYERSTSELTRLSSYPGYDAHAQFSPDGDKILYHRQQGDRDDGGYHFNLILYELESGTETQLTNGVHEQSYGAWAPDGQHIVFSSDVDGLPAKPNLYVLSPDGKTKSRLTRGKWKDSYAFWSRDGKYVYFNSDRAGASNVYRMPMEGLDCIREDVES